MLQWFKANSVSTEEADKLSPESLASKVVVGELVKREAPSLTETVYAVLKEAQKR
jgi:hypothetical protein